MKRSLLMLVLLVAATGLFAQNPYYAPVGMTVTEEGAVNYVEPHTLLAVDLTVACDRTMAGPYARYAQKFLGQRAPLTDRVEWRVVSGAVALMSEAEYLQPSDLPKDSRTLVQHAVSEEEFARIQPDKRTILMPETEEAAREAANMIFSLRKHRHELITGEAGEHVFGEGLKAALDEIARQEQALLELFLGKQIQYTTSRRYIVQPDATKQQYVVCRFSGEEGLLPSDDLLGDLVLLQIQPQAKVAAEVVEAGPKDLTTMKVLVANRATCQLSVAGEHYDEKVLPIFEFGRTLTIAVPRRK